MYLNVSSFTLLIYNDDNNVLASNMKMDVTADIVKVETPMDLEDPTVDSNSTCSDSEVSRILTALKEMIARSEVVL